MPRDLSTPPEILRMRKKLSAIDKAILKLFKRRFACLERLAKAKLVYDYPIEDEDREKEMFKKWKKIFKNKKTDPEFIEDLFELVVDSSKEFQETYFNKHLK